MPSPWQWDPGARRYQDAAGHALDAADLRTLREEFVGRLAAQGQEAARQLAGKEVTVQAWMTRSRDLLKGAYLDQYLLARGGKQAMTQADWGRVGGLLSNQFRYLQQFGEQVAAGQVTEAQAAARAALYYQGSRQAFERGQAAACGVGGLDLPDYPGDGSSSCLGNCTCAWQVEETAHAWEATWMLGDSRENCPECASRADEWAPYVVEK